MPTLVLSRRFSDDSNRLWRAAVAAGWDVERLMGYVPPEDLALRDPVPYGETLLADLLAGPLGLAFLEPTAEWLPGLPERHRRREIRLATLADARALAEPAFVKPVAGKFFPAAVHAGGSAIDPVRAFDDAEAVYVAEPVSFDLEVRSFVLERQVATLSAYVRDGEVACSPDGTWPLSREEETEARACLESILHDEAVDLPAAVVVDVGRIVGRGWAVVEANAAWGSGLAGCDARAVLEVVARASVPIDRLSREDARWRRPLPE